MKKIKVINRKNLPAKQPFLTIVTFMLVLDRLNAPQWLWGAVGVIGLIMIVLWIVIMIREESVDIIHTLLLVSKKALSKEKKDNENNNKV